MRNEIKTVHTISKDLNMNFGLEKCARIYLNRCKVQSKMHVGNRFENDIKKLDPRKAYEYLGIEESFDIQHKNEKENLKKEYLRRLRLVLGTELSAKNKIQGIGSLAVAVLRYGFEVVNWHQKTAKTRSENEETTNHSWTASSKGRCRWLVCTQKTGRKGSDAVGSSPCSINYKTDGICRQEGRPANTGCQNTPTQHQLSSVTDS